MSGSPRFVSPQRISRGLFFITIACLVVLAVQRVGTAQTGRGASLLARARQISLEVSQQRGLPQQRPICHRLASKAEMVELVRSRVRSQYSAGELVREGQLLELLGLIESQGSYEQRVYRMLGDGASGIYDPVGECLYLASWLPWEEQVDTLYHETVHALQDQHFDLEQLLLHRPGESDRLAAASAITEGDATAVTLMMRSDVGAAAMISSEQVRELRSALLAPLPGAPQGGLGEYVRHMLAFSYADGLRRVQSAYAQGNWRSVNGLLSRPPASTEEVLHPERAAAGDRIVEVSLSRPEELPVSCRVVHRDTLGELMLKTVLDRHLSSADAAASVSGWGGDQAIVLDGCPEAGHRTLILATVWDEERGASTAAAERFFSGLTRSLQGRHGRQPIPSRGGVTMTFELGRGRCSIAARRGGAVVYVEGIGCSSGAQLEDELFRQILIQ